jgi:nucleotide-binding universal stress UspA family protein
MDFSGYARQALTCAVPLARRHRAKISLVHVVRLPVGLRTTPDGGIVTPLDASVQLEVARTHLDNLANQLVPQPLRGRTIVREGFAATEVAAVAKRLQADLIVLSLTARSPLKRVVLGSTAERIVRIAHCPVLAVHRTMDASAKRLLALRPPLYPRHLPWRRILVPLDGSRTSLRALQAAVPLAKSSGARLLLLRVIAPRPLAAGLEAAALLQPDPAPTQKSAAQLPPAARRFIPESIRATSLIARGAAVEVIAQTAEDQRADLIVLSAHGPAVWNRLLRGTLAEQVLHRARCPVFILRNRRKAHPDNLN